MRERLEETEAALKALRATSKDKQVKKVCALLHLVMTKPHYYHSVAVPSGSPAQPSVNLRSRPS